MDKKIIYFDNAATTPLREEVFEAMKPFFTQNYGNPSSIYSIAKTAKKAVDEAREQIASLLGCEEGEIYFTSGGSESDNWALRGTAHIKGKGHIITTNVEHHAILHTLEDLKRSGFDVTYVPVDEEGLINPKDIEAAIREDTILISVMFANNEIGTIEPIEEIAKIAKAHNIYFHTDAVQAVGHIPIDVKKMGIDMLSLSAHKLNGPKGVGALYIKKGIKIAPFITGGAQEKNHRAGTENVAGIVGLGKACQIAKKDMVSNSVYLEALRDRLIDGILSKIPHSWLNGHRTKRLPGNCNFGFEFIEGESMLLFLDAKGICASSGSACTSGSLDPSHVLLAIGLPHEKAHGSLRITLGHQNTMGEIDTLIEVLPPIVARLRDMSPLYETYLKSNKKENN